MRPPLRPAALTCAAIAVAALGAVAVCSRHLGVADLERRRVCSRQLPLPTGEFGRTPGLSLVHIYGTGTVLRRLDLGSIPDCFAEAGGDRLPVPRRPGE